LFQLLSFNLYATQGEVEKLQNDLRAAQRRLRELESSGVTAGVGGGGGIDNELQISSLGLMDSEWQEREQNLLRQLEDERFRYCPPTRCLCASRAALGFVSDKHAFLTNLCFCRWGEALRLEEQRIRIEEAGVREEALQVRAALAPTRSPSRNPHIAQAETDRLGQVCLTARQRALSTLIS
jgi:hypothetical protein